MNDLKTKFEKRIDDIAEYHSGESDDSGMSESTAMYYGVIHGAMSVYPILAELVEALSSISYKVDENEPYISLYIPTVDMININKTLDNLNDWLDGTNR